MREDFFVLVRLLPDFLKTNLKSLQSGIFAQFYKEELDGGIPGIANKFLFNSRRRMSISTNREQNFDEKVEKCEAQSGTLRNSILIRI